MPAPPRTAADAGRGRPGTPGAAKALDDDAGAAGIRRDRQRNWLLAGAASPGPGGPLDLDSGLERTSAREGWTNIDCRPCSSVATCRARGALAHRRPGPASHQLARLEVAEEGHRRERAVGEREVPDDGGALRHPVGQGDRDAVMLSAPPRSLAKATIRAVASSPSPPASGARSSSRSK